MTWAKAIKNSVISLVGWRTKQRILVIESDDWGTVRMPSVAAFDRLKAKGIDLTAGDSWRYNRYDTLASSEDLDHLFSILRKFKDQHGRHPVFTALCLTSNPDFDAIRQNRYERYSHEPFTETLKRYYPNESVFSWWQQGIRDQLFVPQFHGREHLNVNAWMRSLQRGDAETQLAFHECLWGFNNKHAHNLSFQAAFDLENAGDLANHEEIIKDGLNLFKHLFGYRASFFVPPNGILHEDLYEPSRSAGIDFLFSANLHSVPVGPGKSQKRLNYLGKQNRSGQIFIVRNCFFEPSQGDESCVDNCLEEIETAFRWNKPAIISSHRVNYIGSLSVQNRQSGLEKLEKLLSETLKRWPEVEFMTTVELGQIIKETTYAR